MSSKDDNASGSSAVSDILSSMAAKPNTTADADADSPPMSPYSQPVPPPHIRRGKIPAAPILPRSTKRTSFLPEGEAERQSSAAFANPASYTRNGTQGRKNANGNRNATTTTMLPDAVFYRLYVLARSKACIMTLVDEKYNVRGWTSAGRCGFKNSAEGSYEAGYQCAVQILSMLRSEIERRRGSVEVCVEVMLNGFGQGRGALVKALSMAEGDGIRDAVVKVTDMTPIRVGGVRLQKRRRL